MKTLLVILLFLFTHSSLFAQGRSISKEPKIYKPYITAQADTVHVGNTVLLKEGVGQNGVFLYVQMLNGFNEPISTADSRAAGQSQKVLFFKEQNGVTYLFTKYFSVNIEPALAKGEIEFK